MGERISNHRLRVLKDAHDCFENSRHETFVPGETYVPVTGKRIDGSDIAAIVDAALDGWLTEGRFAKQLEGRLREFTGARDCALTVSGSAANLLAFSAMCSKSFPERIEPGSEVLTVAAGFPTTVAPIVQNRCVPVFVDVDLETCNVNIDMLASAVTPRTRAIVLAHTLGNPFAVEAVLALAKSHNLLVLEDCCDALGATFGDKAVGSFGQLATVSFYPAHQMTTGEGGAVFMNDVRLCRSVQVMRDWGRDCWCPPGKDNTCGKRFGWTFEGLPEGYDHKYVYADLGYNLKMTDMQAAIGCSQLSKVPKFIEKRRENHAALTAFFKKEGFEEFFVLPRATAGSEPSWFGYCVTLRDSVRCSRKDVVAFLETHKVGTRLLFAGNMLRQPMMKGVEARAGSTLDATDTIMNRSFWIGVWPGIDPPRLHYIFETFFKLREELL
jgi:CDP-6-deoxy-D-xylo-4-hexulose-3-dehydrase